MKLNLGSCDRHIAGFLSVDIFPCAGVDLVADLSLPWPWLDSSIEEVRAYDIFEHIGNCEHIGEQICNRCKRPEDPANKVRHWSGRIHAMGELWRVLQPGGRAIVEVPSATKGAGYAQDPTHVSPYCLNSFQYYEAGKIEPTRFAGPYGMAARFRVIDLSETSYTDRELVVKITAHLEAVK